MYTRTDILYPMQAPDVGAVGGWCKFRIKQYKGVRERKRVIVCIFLKWLLNMETFSLFNSKGQLVVEFLIRFIRWKVNAIETGEKKESKKQ